MKNNRVLVLGNPLNHEGGMVVFNRGLIKTLNSRNNSYELESFSIGSRMALFYYPILKRLVYPFLLLFDLFLLFIRLYKEDVKIIQLNPSLIPVPMIRDGIVLFINKFFFKKKSVIVLHGWKEHIFKKIKEYKLFKFIILKFFDSGNIIYVLSEEFRCKLISLGLNESKIKVTTTFFYENDINDISLEPQSSKVRFVFLGRVSKLKGMSELIEAFKIVNETHDNFICKIIGHGDQPKTIENYKLLTKEKKIDNKIIFLGRKTGYDKFYELRNSDIYVLPSHMEGCPTTAIEALASGLYVISTDVGALNDIITKNNGIKVGVKQINELAEAIKVSIENLNLIRSKRNEISSYAFCNFEVTNISKQFHKDYEILTKFD